VPSPYRLILARPGAWKFSGAGLIARFPIATVGIGIVLLISATYDSYALAGRVSAVYVFSLAVCAPQLSRLVDRHGQARIMRPSFALTGTGLVVLIVVASTQAHPVVLYLAAALSGATTGSLGSLVRARWSAMLDDHQQLHTAYALESTIDEVIFVSGPVIVTFLATSVAPWSGLALPLVAILVGGYLLLAQRSTEPVPQSRENAGVPRGSVLRAGGVVVVAVVFMTLGGIFGATDVAVIAFSEEHGAKGMAGVLLAVLALGSLIAGLGYGARPWHSPLRRRFALGVLVLGAGVSLFLVVDSMVLLGVVMFITGFAIAPTLINGHSLIQRFVPRQRLTEGLAWASTGINAGVALGSSLAGAEIDRADAGAGFVVVAGAAGAAVVVTFTCYRLLRTSALHQPLPSTS